MSITSPDDRTTTYQPGVPTAEFAAGFPVFDNDDLAVFVDGEERDDFAVSATYHEGISTNAKAVFATGVVGTVQVVGIRAPRRTNRFMNGGPLPVRDVNLALDTVEAEVQEVDRETRRAVKSERGAVGSPPVIAGQLGDGVALVHSNGRIEGGPTVEEISGAAAAAAAAIAALASILNTLGPALPQTYSFDVGDAIQSVDLLNPAITKAHILSIVLGGVEQMDDTFDIDAGVITPVDGAWPVAEMQVKVGIGLPISLAAAIPIANSVRNVHVAPDADIDASKVAYFAAPAVRRSLAEKFGDTINLRDFGASGSTLGSFDNKPAWDAAIAHILSLPRGGCIHVPAGRYGAVGRIDFPKTAGKAIRVVGDGYGTVIDVTGAETHAWYVGGPSAPGGTNFRAEHMMFAGGSGSANRAFRLENANGAEFANLWLETMLHGFDASASYALNFVNLQFENVGGVSIYSSTHAHNMIVDRCHFFNSGMAALGRAIELGGHTDNLVIQNSDFEFCRQVLSLLDGGSALRFVGNYVEYCDTDPFGFAAPVYGAEINGNWLALGEGFEFVNLVSGAFQRNRIHDQEIYWNASCRDVTTGQNRLTGTAYMQPFIGQEITAFLNGSAAGARAVRYFKDEAGFVHVSGEVVVGVNGSAAFVMPAGYRPSPAGVHPRFGTLSTVDNANAFVIFDSSNGNVVPTCAGNQTITLDGISYKAE